MAYAMRCRMLQVCRQRFSPLALSCGRIPWRFRASRLWHLAAFVFIVMRSHRAAIGTLLATGAVFFAGFSLMAYSSDVYVRHVLHIKLLGSPELQQHPSVEYVNLGLQLFGEAVTAIVCAKLHRRFVLGRAQKLIAVK